MELMYFFNCFNFIQFKWKTKHFEKQKMGQLWYSTSTIHSMQHNCIYFLCVLYVACCQSIFIRCIKNPLKFCIENFKDVLNHKCLV